MREVLEVGRRRTVSTAGFRFHRLGTFIRGMDIRLLQPFAFDHHGLITLDAALRVGISRSSWYRAIAAGLLEQIHPGVARLVGSRETREQRIMAAVLAVGGRALASHRSAGYLWGIPRPDQEPVDLIVDIREREAQLDGVVLHRPRDTVDLRRVLRDRIPTTNILRTLCDLGAVDPAAVDGAVGHALATKLATISALERTVIRHSEHGRHGIVALRDAVQGWQLDGKPADSDLERAMYRLVRDFRLPPVVFHPVIEGYEVDFLIADTPIVIECDGWVVHGLDRRQFDTDRDRDADLTSAGYVVLRRTYRQIAYNRLATARKIENLVRHWAPHRLRNAG